MKAATATAPSWCWHAKKHHRHPTQMRFLHPRFPHFRGLGVSRARSNRVYVSAWDDKPFEILESGKKAYLDEQDVVTFLDPPKDLIPLDQPSYNPAAYLWKKIEDIPEERRHRLLRLLTPRLVSMAWQIAGTRYEDSKLVKKSASTLLSNSNKDDVMLEYYNCRTSGDVREHNGYEYKKAVHMKGPLIYELVCFRILCTLENICHGPMPISWINSFRTAIYSCKDGKVYGRLIGGSVLAAFTNSITPLYFTVSQLKEVMSTEQPCDLAYEFGDGLFDIKELPQGFPRPVKHPYPFDDHLVIYVRHLGPGVSVGQAWQEGKKLEQVPQKLCGEILMVKDYTLLQDH